MEKLNINTVILKKSNVYTKIWMNNTYKSGKKMYLWGIWYANSSKNSKSVNKKTFGKIFSKILSIREFNYFKLFW